MLRAAAAAVLVLALALPGPWAADFDPYRVLGLGRAAGAADIKKAYKRLAREWYVPSSPPPGSGPHRGLSTAVPSLRFEANDGAEAGLASRNIYIYIYLSSIHPMVQK